MQTSSKKGEYLEEILRSPKTVFSTKDIALLWGVERNAAFKVRLSKYRKSGKLARVHHSIYTKDLNYDRLELGTRIYTPSYIGFETVLAKSGVIFQYYSQIFVATYKTREVVVNKQTYSFRRIRDLILTDNNGIEFLDNYNIASPERAFLDIVYLYRHYHFDNLSALNWDKVHEILPIYKNKSMEKRVLQYHKLAEVK